MRELERTPPHTSPDAPAHAGPSSVGLIGPGRVGTVLAGALRAARYEVDGPRGRAEGVPAGEVVLLCVPDAEIAPVAAAIGPELASRAGAPTLVGHTSGATPLAALAAAGMPALGLHPLQTLAGGEHPGRLRGAGAAVAGTTPGALAVARALALGLGLVPVTIEDDQRPAYHAAASIASNFLVTLEAAAERVAGAAGLAPEDARALLAPLVRTTVENWAERGPEAALTGPVRRGDEATVAAQRAAVGEAEPPLLPLFDLLVDRTRELAARADTLEPVA